MRVFPSDEPMSDEDKAAMARYEGTGLEPHEPPLQLAESFLSPRRLCLCGLRWIDHYDGWDGSRLGCAEANRRHPMGQILGRQS